MNKVITGLLALALIGVTACGNSTPPPPPADGCTHSCSPKPVEETPAPKPKGKSYAMDYSKEMKATFAAEKKYYAAESQEEKDEAYIELAEHLYAALAFAAMHKKSGHTKSLSQISKLKRAKGDFKTTLGPSDHPRVKAAVKKWEESISQ